MTEAIREVEREAGKPWISARVEETLMQKPAFLAHPRTVAVLGAGLALGQPIAGVEYAPQALRSAGLHKAIEDQSWNSADGGDVSMLASQAHQSPEVFVSGQGLIKNSRLLGDACAQIALKAEKIARNRHMCLTIGGDHSVALGSIAGLLRVWPNLSVIWVDAHGDFNTPESSPSGNLHGMPLAGLTGAFSLNAHAGFEWFHAGLDPRRVALVGIRSLDRGEKLLLKSSGVNVFTMTEIDRFGIGKVMEMALAAVSTQGAGPVHLSYDIDALDPTIAPSTGTRVRGGLNYREAHYIAEAVAETGRLVGMDLVEVNPGLNARLSQSGIQPELNLDSTVEIGLEIIESALGKRIFADDFDDRQLTG